MNKDYKETFSEVENEAMTASEEADAERISEPANVSDEDKDMLTEFLMKYEQVRKQVIEEEERKNQKSEYHAVWDILFSTISLLFSTLGDIIVHSLLIVLIIVFIPLYTIIALAETAGIFIKHIFKH